MDSPKKKAGGYSDASAHGHDVSGTTKSTLGKGYKDTKSEHRTEEELMSTIITQPQEKLDLAVYEDSAPM